MSTAKQLYLIRHGESTFNEWRKKSIWTLAWIFVRDPEIYDAKLSKRGERQVDKLHQTLIEMGLIDRIELVR